MDELFTITIKIIQILYSGNRGLKPCCLAHSTASSCSSGVIGVNLTPASRIVCHSLLSHASGAVDTPGWLRVNLTLLRTSSGESRG
jgi:hypothetical protein